MACTLVIARYSNTPLCIGVAFVKDWIMCCLITAIIWIMTWVKGSTRYIGILVGTYKSFAGAIVCVILAFHFGHLRHEGWDNISCDLVFWINLIWHKICKYLRALANCQNTYQQFIFYFRAFQRLKISIWFERILQLIIVMNTATEISFIENFNHSNNTWN